MRRLISQSTFLPSRTVCTGLAGLLVGAMVMTSAPARAADDDDAPDIKFIRGILHGFGLTNGSDGIDYRERSPLVIPPSRLLPPPEKSAVAGNPNWPVDPEIKQKKAAKAAERATGGVSGDPWVEASRVLRPDELNRGPRVDSERDRTSRTEEQSGRPLSAKELGSTGGFFDFFKKREDVAVFTGEPPRETLIEPPPGYRTPSPNQPYGIGKDATKPVKAENFLETHGTTRY